MYPNLVGVLVSAEIILLLSSRELFSYPRSLSQEEVLPSAVANGAATSAGLSRGKIQRAVRFIRQVWMDQPFRRRVMAGAAQTVGHELVGFELWTQ